MPNAYLKQLSTSKSFWWNDSAVPAEIDAAIANGATGATTNPVLVRRSLYSLAKEWAPALADMPALSGDAKAEELIRRVTIALADKFLPIFEATNGAQGYVCAQVNPNFPGDAGIMLDMAKRLHSWARNIAVKLPVTAAGLDAVEECAALGITTVGTVSFTVPQVLEVARRQQLGWARAKAAGIKPGAGFSVIMVGRLDDYLRDVAHDSRADVREDDIIQAGTAAIKRAYTLFRECGYNSKLMPAGMRGAYHATALAGADMTMSLALGIQGALGRESAFVEGINDPVATDAIERLMTMPEFRKAYEPDGMKPEEFIAYGATQRTLSQFVDVGWGGIAEF